MWRGGGEVSGPGPVTCQGVKVRVLQRLGGVDALRRVVHQHLLLRAETFSTRVTRVHIRCSTLNRCALSQLRGITRDTWCINHVVVHIRSTVYTVRDFGGERGAFETVSSKGGGGGGGGVVGVGGSYV